MMDAEPTRPAVGGPAPAFSPDVRRASIGWLRGIATAVAVFAVAFAGVAVAPNLVLDRGGSFSRDTRALLATALCVGVVVAMAFALRKLQARGRI